MNAEIIAVGSEMLTESRLDTNSLFVTGHLNTLGVEVAAKHVIGDDRSRLTDAIRRALSASEIVILTGGLGPTEDDLTRECAAAALDRTLTLDETVLAGLAAKFARMNRRMADNNRQQAMVIAGAEVLDNPHGTAPGQWIGRDAGALLLLPGPPRELKPMFERECLPRLRRILPPLALATRWFRIAGMGESDCDALIAPVYREYTNPVTTILSKPGDIELHLRARASDAAEAERLCAELAGKIEPLLGDRIYSRDGSPLEAVVGRMLAGRGETVAVAESMTGGLLGARLTETPGASAWFRGGYLVYAPDLKESLLGGPLPGDPVSPETAIALAQAARERSRATWGVSVTGYAGGATAAFGERPDGRGAAAGLVFVGLAGPAGVIVREFRLLRERALVRTYTATYALDLLRKQMLTAAAA